MLHCTSGAVRILPSGHAADSLSACVHAALGRWGRHPAYDCVAGLSGSAFSPAHATTEQCASWWMEARSDTRLEFLGHALGFSVERPAGDISDPEFGRRTAEALRAGDVVLCAAWPCWSIVTQWHEDPARIRLAAPSGLAHRCRVDAGTRIYVLRNAERALTECEAIREALRFAAARATQGCQEQDVAYGGRLYDAWQTRLEEAHICKECAEGDRPCSERTAARMRSGQLSAAQFLRRAGALLPSLRATGAAEATAAAYRAMADRLLPYAWGGPLRDAWRRDDGRKRYALAMAEVRRLHERAACGLSALTCRV